MEMIKEEAANPLQISCIMLISRLCVIFVPSYWILMHCACLLIISILLITILVLKLWKLKTMRTKEEEKYDNMVEKVQVIEPLRNDLIKVDNIQPPELDKRSGKQDKKNIYFGLIPIGLLIAFFVIWGIILWSVNQSFRYAKPAKIEYKGSYEQGVFFPLGWAIVISYTLLCIWFRHFQVNNFQMNWWLWIIAGVSILAIYL